MTSRKKRWALVGAGIGLAASVSAAAIFFELPMSTAATAASAPAQAPAVPVTVAVVQSRDVTAWESFSGRLEAVDRVQVRPRVAGAIQSVHFREGALVKAGDLLFTIDPAPYQAAVAQAARPGRVGRSQGRPGADRTRPRPQAFRQSHDLAERSRSASEHAGRGASGPPFGSGSPSVRSARSRLHASARSGFRPYRQDRGHCGQPRRCRFHFAGTDDARLRRSDLCELQRERRDGHEGAFGASGNRRCAAGRRADPGRSRHACR